MRRALVTGATGFTGGHLARTLAARGYQVKALVRSPDSDVAQALARDGITVVAGDVTRAGDVERAVAGASHVFHIAALYRTANHTAAEYAAVNAEAVSHVIGAARRHGTERIVHCSTCGVHGDVSEIPSTETAPFKPGDDYQRTKLEGEMRARAAIEGGMPISIVRPTGIYGPGDLRFLKLFKAIQSGRFRMFGSGEIAYHMTYIDDMVDGIILAGEREEAIGETFLIASDDYTSLNELVHKVAGTLGVSPPRGRLPLAPLLLAADLCELVCRPVNIDPPLHRRRCEFFTKARAFSNAKAKALIGFEPKVPLGEGLRRTADWYIAQGLLKAQRAAA